MWYSLSFSVAVNIYHFVVIKIVTSTVSMYMSYVPVNIECEEFHSDNHGCTCNPPIYFLFTFRPAGWFTDLHGIIHKANIVLWDGTEGILLLFTVNGVGIYFQ